MEGIRRASLWIFYALLAYMPLHILLSTWLGTSFGALEFAKIAKDILLIIGFVFAFCSCLGQPWFKQFFKDKLIWLIAGYALLTILLTLVRPTDADAEILGVVYNLRFLVVFVYGLMLAKLFDTHRVRNLSIKIVLGVGVLVVVFGVLQYLVLPSDILTHAGYSRANGVLPAFFIDDKPDLERIMSTVRDPNSLGSYLIILGPLVAAAAFMQKDGRKKAWLGAYFGLILLSVIFTFSRSGWLGFALAMVSFVALGQRFGQMFSKHKRPILIGAAAFTILLLGTLFAFRSSYFVQNTILHSDQSTTLEDPNELRIKFFKESVDNISEQPLGSGPGTAGLVSIRNNVQGTQLNENYYLQIASEVGIVGLALFLAILATVGWRLFVVRQANPFITALLAGFIGLALTNFLVHIWSNEAVAYTWWGMAGIFLAAKPSKKKAKANK